MAAGRSCDGLYVDFDDVLSEPIKVVVICRPMGEKELSSNCTKVVKVTPKAGSIKLQMNKKTSPKVFSFDAVYDCCSPKVIYEDVFHPLVEAVMYGFNGTIFTYGYSGAGKSFTMEGNPEHEGVIPAALKHIFGNIALAANIDFIISASYLEVYQEKIFDLLSNPKKLVGEKKNDAGAPLATTVICKTLEEIETLLVDGKDNRFGNHVDSANLRSHTIFVINIESHEHDEKGYELVRKGQLKLVDLSGKQLKTNATSMKDKDCKSLEVLGNVISALTDGKNTRIPYTDSSLTTLLQDTLGGNSKSIMIANISPASCYYHDTVMTLRDAKKVSSIRNKAVAVVIKNTTRESALKQIDKFKQHASEKTYEELVQEMDKVFIEESAAKTILNSVKKHMARKKGRQVPEDFEGETNEALEKITRNLDVSSLSDPRKANEFFRKCLEALPNLKKK